MALQKIELRTLAPKKWLLSLFGAKPTIDENYTGNGKGCHVGDLVIDVSQDPFTIWICTVQIADNSDFIQLKQVAIDTFIELEDCPSTYVDEAGKLAVVNQNEDGMEFSISPPYPKTSVKIANYTVNMEKDYIIPVNANLNNITIYLPVGKTIDAHNSVQLNVQYESKTLHTAYKSGRLVTIKRLDNSSHIVTITPMGDSSADNWLEI